MPENKRLDTRQAEYRGLGTDLAAAAVAGATGGAAGAAVNQAVNAIRKPKDEPPPAQQPKKD